MLKARKVVPHEPLLRNLVRIKAALARALKRRLEYP